MEMGDVTFVLSLGLIGFRHQQCECYENNRRPPLKVVGGRMYTVDVIFLFSHQESHFSSQVAFLHNIDQEQSLQFYWLLQNVA
ncbi:hypothetical protein ZWY2020_031349 [Hordeum vulgare]|nr:hypothetical protein ZWY2020_031349 [Hordeum vulgare]